MAAPKPDQLPVVVERVIVEQDQGVTSSEYLKRFTKNVEASTDLQSLLIETQLSKQKMEQTGIFKTVNVSIDTTEGYNNSSPSGYQVIYDVKEKKLNLQVGTDLSPESLDPEGSLKLSIPNMFGNGEKMQCSFGREAAFYETAKSFFPNVSLNFGKVMSDEKTSLNGALTHSSREKPWCNVSEENIAGTVGLSRRLSNKLSVGISGNTRLLNLTSLSKNDTPLSVREQFGYTKKHYFNMNVDFDSSKEFIRKVVPSGGMRLRTDTDLWQNGYRVSSEFSLYRPLFSGVTGCLQASAGYTSDKVGIHLADKFFIGGNNNLRGFAMNSHGPRENGCALGGEAMVQGGIHVYSSLELLSQVYKGLLQNLVSPQVALHAFAVAGNVGNLTSITKDPHTYAASYGAGLAMSLFEGVPLNLEANLVRTNQDKKFKFQCGFSLSI